MEPRDPLAKHRSNFLEGLHLRNDDEQLRNSREFLQRGGEYQSGLEIALFDETGQPRFFAVWEVRADGTVNGLMNPPNTDSPNFSQKRSPQADYQPATLDRFTRGLRADVVILAHHVFFETSGFTAYTIGQAAALLRKMAGEDVEIPKTADEIMREQLSAGARELFLSDPPSYQAMFDAAIAVADWNKQRAESRAGIKLADLRTADDIDRALRQVMGKEFVQVVDATKQLPSQVLSKYGSRIAAALRLALITMELWYEEQGNARLQQTTIDE